jgi:hypothetical protein
MWSVAQLGRVQDPWIGSEGPHSDFSLRTRLLVVLPAWETPGSLHWAFLMLTPLPVVCGRTRHLPSTSSQEGLPPSWPLPEATSPQAGRKPACSLSLLSPGPSSNRMSTGSSGDVGERQAGCASIRSPCGSYLSSGWFQ